MAIVVGIHPAARTTCHTAEASILSSRIPPRNDFPARGFRLSLEHRAADFANGSKVEAVRYLLNPVVKNLRGVVG